MNGNRMLVARWIDQLKMIQEDLDTLIELTANEDLKSHYTDAHDHILEARDELDMALPLTEEMK